MSDWLAGVPAAMATVVCNGEIHRLAWRDGELIAEDHADPEAERAIAALGGSRCRCVELLDAWATHRADPRALLLGPRGDEGGQRREMEAANRAVSIIHRSGGPRNPEPEDLLLVLLSLDGDIPRRLVATVAEALSARGDDPAMRAQLEAALYGRVLASLGTWLGEFPELELEVIAADAERSLTREGRVVQARLPLRWLTEVWGREVTTVWGRFTLSVARGDERDWNLLTVDAAGVVGACSLSFR